MEVLRRASIPRGTGQGARRPAQLRTWWRLVIPSDGNIGANGARRREHQSAPAGTPVAMPPADGRVMEWRPGGLKQHDRSFWKHCLRRWTSGGCVGGEQVVHHHAYCHQQGSAGREPGGFISGHAGAHDLRQTINSHLHFRWDAKSADALTSYVNPWGGMEAPWLGCVMDRLAPVCQS